MVAYTVDAEYDPLREVRVHEPGFETLIGATDPSPNHFSRAFSVRKARIEHRRMVETLESAGVTVRYLHKDLEGAIDELLAERFRVDDDGPSPPSHDELLTSLDAQTAYERLQALLLGPTFGRTSDDPTLAQDAEDPSKSASTVAIERPISNIYFQRDCQIVGDRGPILPRPATSTRQRESQVVEKGWQAIDAEFAGRTSEPHTLEGGDFLPADDFALVGTSAVSDGEEHVLRTSYDGGRELLETGSISYEEVGLVRPPLAVDERLAQKHGASSRLMHLDGWVNIAADGLAVGRLPLLKAATVEVFDRTSDGYVRRETETLAELFDRHDYQVINAPYDERWATNFLTVDDGAVVAIHEANEAGYDPDNNQTIDRLKAEGVDILPDGEGLELEHLTNGGGGVHCMTTPIRRG